MDRYVALALLLAVAQARFEQENIPIAAIAAVQGGNPGAAATIAGAAISDLLAGSNACDKLVTADQIVSELGGGADAIAAAIGMVAAEKNTNPFVVDVPSICNDPTLPATPELRGITPLIDPNTNNAEVANALSAQTVATPLDATGKSIADLLTENGFTDFNPQDSDGAGAGAANAAAGNVSDADANAAAVQNATATSAAAAQTCVAANANANATANTDANANDNTNDNANDNANGNNNAGAGANDVANGNAGNANNGAAGGNAGGAGDFGTCDPTMSFLGGRNGRPADEFTFQSNDPVIEANQQEALNPNIITNRICDELGNTCGADATAIATCEDAQAQIEALGTRDQTTADAWNQLVGGGAAKRSMRRGMRL